LRWRNRSWWNYKLG